MKLALYSAAGLIVAVGVTHSFLGERYILGRLFRRGHLPKIFGSDEFTRRTLRFAWHLTSIAWLGFGAILLALARPPVAPSTLGLIVGGTFLIHFAIALLASRGRHLSWLVFLAIAILSIYATRA